MKYVLALSAVVIVILALWRGTETTTSAPTAEEKPAPNAMRAAQRVSPPAAKIAVQPQPLKGEPPERRAPDNQVAFEVIDGYAVAFGDVILGKPEDETLKSGFFDLPVPGLWERPEIPFHVQPDLQNPGRVREALRHIEKKTGLKFVPYEGQGDAIVFENGPQHCLSALGRVGGLQPIRISPKCSWNAITHEVMHSLGFIHEQSRPDRDSFVEVVWENIEERYKDQFEMLPEEFTAPLRGFPFDYSSLMLYDPTFFSKRPGEITLKSRTARPIRPSEQGLSELDVQRVRRLFRLD